MPFFRECRAYGRIKQHGIDGKYTARCYGHLPIDSKKAEELAQHFHIEWNETKKPLQALVKELVEHPSLHNDEPLLNVETLKKMYQLDIIVLDVEGENLVSGRIKSLAMSEVLPFYKDEFRNHEERRAARDQDFIDYQNRLKAEGSLMEVYRGGRVVVFDPDWQDGQLSRKQDAPD